MGVTQTTASVAANMVEADECSELASELVNLQAIVEKGIKFEPTTVTLVPPLSGPEEGMRAVTSMTSWK